MRKHPCGSVEMYLSSLLAPEMTAAVWRDFCFCTECFYSLIPEPDKNGSVSGFTLGSYKCAHCGKGTGTVLIPRNEVLVKRGIELPSGTMTK
jgi:hypothetical protein